MVLIALKTDGGGHFGARSYMAGKKAAVDRWLIGADDGAGFYKTIMGKDGLWEYLVISPEGRIAAKGQCGRYYKKGDKTVYALAEEDLVGKYAKGKTRTLLPKDKTYHASLARALTALRCNDYDFALGRCRRQAKRKDEAGKSAKALYGDILAGLGREGKAAAAALLGKEPDARFRAYMQLRTIASVIPKEAPGKAAAAAMKSVRADRRIKKEIAAEKAYFKVVNRIKRSKKWVPRKTVVKRLSKVAKKYPDTLFGKRAAAESK